MKKLFYLVLLALCISASLVGQERIPKVLLIGIDGIRPDAFQAANTPNLDSLIANGTYSYDAFTEHPSLSGVGFSTMLTGVWSAKHKVTSNSFVGARFDLHPHIFVKAEQWNPDLHTVSVNAFGWAALIDHTKNFVDSIITVTNFSDTIAALLAGDYLTSQDPDMMFVYLIDADHAGHDYGFTLNSPEYINAVELVDEKIGLILDSLRTRDTYEDEDWMVLVTTDHGGSSTKHNTGSFTDRNIFIIASGDSIPHMEISRDTQMTSIDKAMDFDGISNYAVASVDSPFQFQANGEWAIELRVKTNGNGGNPAMISNKNWSAPTNKGFSIATQFPSGPRWIANIGDGVNQQNVSGGIITDGFWHHLTVNVGKNRIAAFQDGVPLASQFIGYLGDITTPYPLVIGQYGTLDMPFYFDGLISEVRVWNTMLTDNEVGEYAYKQLDENHPNIENLIAYWRMDTLTGNLLPDSGFNNIPLQVFGDTPTIVDDNTNLFTLDFTNTPTLVDAAKTALNHMCIPDRPDWSLDGKTIIPKICEYTPCDSMSNLWVDNLTGTSAILKWDTLPVADHYTLRGYVVGTPIVIPITIPGGTYQLNVSGLVPNTMYAWQIQSHCDDRGFFISPYSAIDTFSTILCQNPAPISTSHRTENSIRLNWANVPNAIGYEIQGRPLSIASYIKLPVSGESNTSFDVSDLAFGAYEWTVRTNCGAGYFSNYAPFDTFVISDMPDTTIIPGDTIITVTDTIFVPADTSLIGADTTIVPADTSLMAIDTSITCDTTFTAADTMVSIDTMIIAADTMIMSADTTILPDTILIGASDTIIIPADTIIDPPTLVIVPADTSIAPDTIQVTPADTVITPADTLIGPSDTTIVPADTVIVAGDTTIVPGDTTYVPADTIVAPDTVIVVPADTIVGPADTTVIPADTIIVPADTTIIPGDTTFIPADTIIAPDTVTIVPADTTIGPADTTIAPTDTIVGPDSLVIAPADTLITPGDTVYEAADTIVGPDSLSIIPGDTIYVQGDTIYIPADTIYFAPDTIIGPPDTTIIPGDTFVIPADTIYKPADTLVTPGDTVIIEADTIYIPADTTIDPPDTIITPADTIFISNDTIINPPDTTIDPADTIITPESIFVFPPTIIITPGDTTYTQGDTIYIMADTILFPTDTTIIPPDTTIIPGEVTYIPADTMIIPPDTAYLPADTTIIPGDTTITPADTVITPGEVVITPADTTVQSGDTTFIPADTIVGPSDTIIGLPDTTITPEQTIIDPGDTTIIPADTTILSGDTTYVAADTVFSQTDTMIGPPDTTITPEQVIITPGDTTITAADTAIIPADTTVIPGDTVITPADTSIVPGDTTFVSSDTIIVPGDTTVLPGSTIIVPADTIITPGDTNYIPVDTIYIEPDTTISSCDTVVNFDTVIIAADTIITFDTIYTPADTIYVYDTVITEPDTIITPLNGSKSGRTEDHVDELSDYENEKVEHELSIFPNPFSDLTKITFENADGDEFVLIVTDMSGNQVRVEDGITTSSVNFERRSLKSGMYYVELIGKRTLRGKIIIN